MQTVTPNTQTETTAAKALRQQLLRKIGKLMAFATRWQIEFATKARRQLIGEGEDRNT